MPGLNELMDLHVVDSLPAVKFEPPRGKTDNVVSGQVRHKPACTVTEDG